MVWEASTGDIMSERRLVFHRALAQRVLVVAVANEGVKDWAAYIDAVPGENHYEEAHAVARNGAKLSEKIADVIFPYMKDEGYTWRR